MFFKVGGWKLLYAILSDGKGQKYLENQNAHTKTEVLSISILHSTNTCLCVHITLNGHTLKPQVFASVFLIWPPSFWLFHFNWSFNHVAEIAAQNPFSFGQLHNPDSLIITAHLLNVDCRILSPENLHVMLTLSSHKETLYAPILIPVAVSMGGKLSGI